MSESKSSEVQFGERIGSGGSDAILSSYFRDILQELAINSSRFQFLLDKYIISQGMPNNSAEIPSSRSALHRELMSQTMTWKVFIKGLLFLRVKTVEMTVVLYRDDCDSTAHEHVFHLVNESRVGDDEPNTLSKFFKGILENLEVEDDVFQEYLDHYIKVSKPGSTPNEQYTAKCQLRREILKNNISWKVFIKGILFLKTYKMVLESRLIFQTGFVAIRRKKLEFK